MNRRERTEVAMVAALESVESPTLATPNPEVKSAYVFDRTKLPDGVLAWSFAGSEFAEATVQPGVAQVHSWEINAYARGTDSNGLVKAQRLAEDAAAALVAQVGMQVSMSGVELAGDSADDYFAVTLSAEKLL